MNNKKKGRLSPEDLDWLKFLEKITLEISAIEEDMEKESEVQTSDKQ